MNTCPKFTVYIVRTSGNTLYIGQTKNLAKRLKEHASKKSAASRYLTYFTSFELVHTEQFPTRGAALRREYELKRLTRKEKEVLLQKSRSLFFE